MSNPRDDEQLTDAARAEIKAAAKIVREHRIIRYIKETQSKPNDPPKNDPPKPDESPKNDPPKPDDPPNVEPPPPVPPNDPPKKKGIWWGDQVED